MSSYNLCFGNQCEFLFQRALIHVFGLFLQTHSPGLICRIRFESSLVIHAICASKKNCLLFSFINKTFFVVQLQLSAFSPPPSTQLQQNPPPSPTSTLPLGFAHVSFIVVPETPSPHYPLPTTLWLLLIVLNFNVSGYILFAFFFC